VLALREWRPGAPVERLGEVRQSVPIFGVAGGRLLIMRRGRLLWRDARGGAEHPITDLPPGTTVGGARRAGDALLVSLTPPQAGDPALSGVWAVDSATRGGWRRTLLPWLPEVVIGRAGYSLRPLPLLTRLVGDMARSGALIGAGETPFAVLGAGFFQPPPPPSGPRPVQLLRASLDTGRVEEMPLAALAPASLGLLGPALCVRTTTPEGPLLLLPEEGRAVALPSTPREMPLAAAGRLWWLEATDPGQPIPPPPLLHSCGPDGRDHRAWGSLPPSLSAFGAVSDQLYWVAQVPGRDRVELGSLGPDGRMRRRGTLPGYGFQPLAEEAGTLYFTLAELREKWWDWSPRGLQAQHARILYRWRV